MLEAGMKGKIMKGNKSGWFILIQDDSENTGGYLLLQSQNSDFTGEGYDDWFESLSDIKRHFINRNWEIEWIDYK